MICQKCYRDRPIEKFALGRKKGARRSRRCADCKKTATCNVKRWHRKGRPCADCGEIQPCPDLITDFPWRDAVCKPCQKAKERNRQREWAANRRLTDPEFRRRQNEAARRWQQRNPDYAAAAEIRRYAAIKSDPARWARHKEDARMRYRLGRERKGYASRPVSEERYLERYGNGYGQATRVPAEPLRPLVHRALSRSNETELAERAKSSPKRIREIDTGRAVQISLVTADKLCTALGVPLALVYPDAA